MNRRRVLESHAHCGVCGQSLEFVYPKDNIANQSTKATEITGAAKVEIKFYVAPCERCMRPYRDLERAVNLIRGNKK